jgi:hypothetical protein
MHTHQESSDLVATIGVDIGKNTFHIEWRVNGVTAAVSAKTTGGGPDYDVARQLAMDPGENTIEIVAYNGSKPTTGRICWLRRQRTNVPFTAAPDKVKPKLHVLAIGINRYVDQGWIPPGSTELLAFPPLSLAVSDAKVLAAALRQAGNGETPRRPCPAFSRRLIAWPLRSIDQSARHSPTPAI